MKVNNTELRMGILGGVCFSVFGQLPSSIIQTVILAALGAVVSFAVSRALQYFFKRE